MTPLRRSFAALVVASLIGQAALAAEVAGTWNLTVNTQAGTGTPTLVLVQNSNLLTGTYTGRFGEVPVTGTTNGTAIEFSFTISGAMGEAHVTYTGTVEGDTMGGSMKMGEMAGGTFTGKKQ